MLTNAETKGVKMFFSPAIFYITFALFTELPESQFYAQKTVAIEAALFSSTHHITWRTALRRHVAVFRELNFTGKRGEGSSPPQGYSRSRHLFGYIHTRIMHDVHTQVHMTNVHSAARCTICILLRYQSPTQF